MSRSVKPQTDPHRQSRFREEARGIMARDRLGRKHGGKIDTGAAIARAFERAYKLGFMDAQADRIDAASEALVEGALKWALIPPRPRHAFWSLCMRTSRLDDRRGHLRPVLTARGTKGWQLVAEGSEPERTMGDGSIRPLVRLRLIEPDPDVTTYLVVGAHGLATWTRFLREGGRLPDDLTAF